MKLCLFGGFKDEPKALGRNNMNAYELQIGDWVTYDGIPSQVTGRNFSNH